MPFADAHGVLARAQQQLSLGELLHGERFSLYESMTALEVMDPRLDAGMRRPGEEARDAGSVEEAVAAGRAPLDLSPERLTAVMDEVLAAGACHACVPCSRTHAQRQGAVVRGVPRLPVGVGINRVGTLLGKTAQGT